MVDGGLLCNQSVLLHDASGWISPLTGAHKLAWWNVNVCQPLASRSSALLKPSLACGLSSSLIHPPLFLSLSHVFGLSFFVAMKSSNSCRKTKVKLNTLRLRWRSAWRNCKIFQPDGISNGFYIIQSLMLTNKPHKEDTFCCNCSPKCALELSAQRLTMWWSWVNIPRA